MTSLEAAKAKVEKHSTDGAGSCLLAMAFFFTAILVADFGSTVIALVLFNIAVIFGVRALVGRFRYDNAVDELKELEERQSNMRKNYV